MGLLTQRRQASRSRRQRVSENQCTASCRLGYDGRRPESNWRYKLQSRGRESGGVEEEVCDGRLHGEVIIFHLSFAIFHFPLLFSIPTYLLGVSTQMENEKWQMTNGK